MANVKAEGVALAAHEEFFMAIVSVSKRAPSRWEHDLCRRPGDSCSDPELPSCLAGTNGEPR